MATEPLYIEWVYRRSPYVITKMVGVSSHIPPLIEAYVFLRVLGGHITIYIGLIVAMGIEAIEQYKRDKKAMYNRFNVD